MRKRLLDWLSCPGCGQELSLVVNCWEGEEVVEGALHCDCGQTFPIIGGVPRMLPDDLRKELPYLYPNFFNRHPGFFDTAAINNQNLAEETKRATINRFGYEWTHFSSYKCDNFEQFIRPLPKHFFSGKVGLDIGCGAGRHAGEASKKGAEIIGIDMSQAVDAARRNNFSNKRVHIVQADIFNLPFRKEIFHFIYSIGVLHHLAEPERGYQALIPFLKKKGSIFIWVYAYAFRKVVLEILRSISRRLSNENIRRMAYVCNLLDYGILMNLYRVMLHLPIVGNTVTPYVPLRVKEYLAHGFHVAYTDWFDRLSAPISNYYKEDKMHDWLARSGLNNTELLMVGDSWWWLYGER